MANAYDDLPSLTEAPMPTGESIGKAFQALFGAPTRLAGRALGVPAYQPTPEAAQPAVMPVPTKATDAAADATTKALKATTFSDARFDATNPKATPGAQATPAAVDPNANVAGWNAHVQAVLANMTGMPQSQVAGVLSQPMPGFNKDQGEAAMQTTDGAPKLLNYGYGSTIIGSGKSESGKLNSFTGVGQGAAPAGAAGVFGPPQGKQSMQDELLQTMRDARALRTSGKDMEAHRLEAQVARFTPAVNAAAEMPVRERAVAVGERNAATNAGELNLKANVAEPEVDFNRGVVDALFSGDPKKIDSAMQIVAARRGAQVQDRTVAPMTYRYNPKTQQFEWMSFPTQPKK
jgi:hypothetical protein